MPLQLPNLDDHTYEDLVAEALSLIPTFAPEWTNHNPSDPGITLIELFAYLTEILIYRLNCLNDDRTYAFLKLIDGPNYKSLQEIQDKGTLNWEIQKAVLSLRQSDRAVTGEDFEQLAQAASAQVARARCIPRRDLESENPLAPGLERPGHVSVVIVPTKDPHSNENNPQPTPDLIQTVRDYLEPRRLLTAQVHIVGPRYLTIGVRLTLVLKPDAVEADVRTRAIAALQKFFDPLIGGTDGRGWPFGRNVFVSEVYALLDNLPGVDYVTKRQEGGDEIVAISSNAEDRKLITNKQLVGITLQLDELVDARINESDIAIAPPIKTSSINSGE
jgi:Baseplate J-like protein